MPFSIREVLAEFEQARIARDNAEFVAHRVYNPGYIGRVHYIFHGQLYSLPLAINLLAWKSGAITALAGSDTRDFLDSAAVAPIAQGEDGR